MYKYITTALFVITYGLLLTVFGEYFLISENDVIDGDTIQINSGENSLLVRLIGIDAPEKGSFLYQEAIDYIKKTIVGKNIEVIGDPYKEDKDKFGRLLRYIIVDKKNINLALISAGYAKEFLYNSNYLFRKEFLLAQLLAKKNKIGIWTNGEKDIYSDCYGFRYSIKHGKERYDNNIINGEHHLFKKESCNNGIITTEKYIDGISVIE